MLKIVHDLAMVDIGRYRGVWSDHHGIYLIMRNRVRLVKCVYNDGNIRYNIERFYVLKFQWIIENTIYTKSFEEALKIYEKYVEEELEEERLQKENNKHSSNVVRRGRLK